jgi:hypothetical protein
MVPRTNRAQLVCKVAHKTSGSSYFGFRLWAARSASRGVIVDSIVVRPTAYKAYDFARAARREVADPWRSRKTTKVFLAKEPTDMRKSFRSLVAVTEGALEQEPTSGHLFVFVNARRDMMKILHWDGGGFWIWYR